MHCRFNDLTKCLIRYYIFLSLQDFTYDWSDLPEPVVTHIFSFLTAADRCRSGRVCKNWRDSLNNPLLWKSMKCEFVLPVHANMLNCIENFGYFVSNLIIVLDQKHEYNRTNSIAAIDLFTKLNHIRLTHLTIEFTGENPLFYAGQEFLFSLSSLFIQIKHQSNGLIRYLNFREMQVNLDDDFVFHIGESCPNLEYLNILNRMLVCKVSPCSIKTLVKSCTKLQEMHLFHTSLASEALDILSEPHRQPFKKLGIVCRREEKYGQDLSSESWTSLTKSSKHLKVDLGFDHTCPLHRVSEIMKPEIPVNDLYFATYTTITTEMDLARQYFEHTLNTLMVHTKPDKEFEEVLLNLVRSCKKLHTLYIYGVIKQEVIDEILVMLPEMKERGSYILRSKMDPAPWTVGEEEDGE